MVKRVPIYLRDGEANDFVMPAGLITNAGMQAKQRDAGHGSVIVQPVGPGKGFYNAISRALTKSKTVKSVAREIIQQQRAANEFTRQTMDVVVAGYNARDAKKLEMTKA